MVHHPDGHAKGPLTDWLQRKIQYALLYTSVVCACVLAWSYSVIFRRRRTPDAPVRKIAAIWYAPRDFQNSRLAHWKRYFERDGYVFDDFAVATTAEFARNYERGSWQNRYRFIRSIVWARLGQFFRLRHYDVIWIGRWFLPHYPLRRAFFERCLRRMVGRLVVDITDGGDYLANPELALDTIAQADTLTVGSAGLVEFYSPRHPRVVYVNVTVPSDRYLVKEKYAIRGKPVLGWMGSPGNMVYLKGLEAVLEALAREREFVLRVICRAPLPLDIPNAEIECHPFEDSTYHQIIGTFDIGLCPQLVDYLATRGKVAMKHQEFLLCGLPQVCSPVGVSEAAVHEENVLIAKRLEDWRPLLRRLIEDEALRERLGRNARATYERLYTYESQYSKLRQALTEIPTRPARTVGAEGERGDRG